jgi:Biotin-lipoyl like
MEDHVAKTRALSIVVTLGLALLTTASPAAAYVIEALTSISADVAADKATLEKAIQAAVVDVATHAVAFTPTEVLLRDAKLVGGRIYLFVVLADAAGDAKLEVLKAASARPSLDRRLGGMGVASRLRRHPYALGSIALLIAVVGGGILALSRHWGSTAGAQGGVPVPPLVPVVAAPVRTRDVGVYLNGLGTVTPLNTVTVKTRVDGELVAVHFKEGQIVSSGDLLAEIDPRPFQAQLTQFEGQLERELGHHAAVHAEPRARRGRAGGAGGDQLGADAPAAGPPEPASRSVLESPSAPWSSRGVGL